MKWEVTHTLYNTKQSVIDQILEDRGYDRETFLSPSIQQLHDPFLMKDMEKGVERTVKAIQNQEKIRIAGDYDADGITSTYIMMKLLSEVGANVSYDIPNRKDGYGLNNQMIDKAYKDGCTLIITCDNGIVCVDQIEYAKTLGIDVIITDHHEPQEVVPNAYAVINPKQKDCPYPFKELAGCAVAWKFCQGILSKLHPAGIAKSLEILEIVATGTIADMMDLIDENRVIATFGLQAYKNTNIVALKQLIRALELEKYPITANTIAYSIGPALNATGRLVTANEAVDMLLEKSPLRSLRSAKYLADLNKERKEWTEQYTQQILAQLEGTQDSVIVYAQPDIPEGIIGILASRVKEALNRPVLLMTTDETDQCYKGSGRSVEGFNLFEVLMKYKDLFLKVGGHEQACGFSIPVENVHILQEVLNQEYKGNNVEPVLQIDYHVEAHQVTLSMAEELTKLEPYGKGNPRPLFVMTNCRIHRVDYIGKNQSTVRMEITNAGRAFHCIGFGMAEKVKEICKNSDWVDIVFYPSVNEWNGRRTLQLEVQDIREGE